MAAVLAVLTLAPARAAAPVHTPRRHLEAVTAAVSAADVVRFLGQATFGPTDALIAHVQQVGFAGYLDEQFDAATSSYPNLPPMPASSKVGCPAGSAATCYRDNYTMDPLQVRFFKNALGNDDQLRQRVALALHEILVVSGEKVQQPSQMAPYLDMLLADAFANYRTILYDLTLNPAISHYLDMVNNDAPALATAFPTTALGKQFQSIAKIISVRGALKMSRQIFFASLSGFDTHTDELNTQQTLLTQVSQALAAFYASTVELGVAGAVTTFTLSDFGRTFQPASGGGTDHAWGNHHFVMGGSVKGGDFYGAFPALALAGPNDSSSEGRWIPTTAVDEYGATLAQWFGVAASSLSTVFPNIGQCSNTDMGFLR